VAQLQSVGEFGLIQRIARRLAVRSPQVALGVGDDAALLNLPADEQAVVTKDLLLEDVHFRRAWTSARDLGWKALAVNLSDLAAMGATPLAAFVGLALPADASLEWVDDFYSGMEALADDFGVTIAGGDTTASHSGIVIAVTAVGHVPRAQAVLRSGACVGDVTIVTGTLGDAALGLRWLGEVRGDRPLQPFEPSLLRAHHLPYPRLRAMAAARAAATIHAGIDLSDGLAGDAAHLAEASNVTLELQAEALPLSDDGRAACRALGQDPGHLALHGGEDYELLLTLAEADAPAVVAAIESTGTRATVIGRVIAREAASIILLSAGRRETVLTGGFDHFPSG